LYSFTFQKIKTNMTTQKINLRFIALTAIILLAAFSRIVPHMPNFSPLGAIGLFGAAHFNKKWQAILIPLAATFLSDLFINNVIYAQYYPTFTWLSQGFYWQYGAYVLITLVAFFIFKKVNSATVLTGALASSAIFFLVSNFGCWPGNFYPQNFGGLMQCYAAGVPFVKGTILGDLFYSAVMFGGFALAQKRFTVLQPATA
jgi:hypothetical protein